MLLLTVPTIGKDLFIAAGNYHTSIIDATKTGMGHYLTIENCAPNRSFI
jgi:hypothetical protein